jgi:hypothetical protein
MQVVRYEQVTPTNVSRATGAGRHARFQIRVSMTEL